MKINGQQHQGADDRLAQIEPSLRRGNRRLAALRRVIDEESANGEHWKRGEDAE